MQAIQQVAAIATALAAGLAAALALGAENTPSATITVTRGTCPPAAAKLYGTTPEQNYRELERLIEVEGKPGDRVELVGTFVGGPLDMLDTNPIAGGELTGKGPEASRLIMLAQHDRIGPEENPTKPGGPAILFPDNGSLRLAGMYLENTPDVNGHEDGALGGWSGKQAGKSSVVLEDLLVKSHDWGLVYDWSLYSNRTVTLRRVKGVAARTFVNLVHSASSYTLAMEDCEIGIDGNLSQSYGESSAADPVTGGVFAPILLRAGTGTARSCTFWVKGMTPPPGFPAKWIPSRIVSVATDQYYSKGATTTKFTAIDCTRKVLEQGSASVVLDLDFRWGQRPVWDADKLAAERAGSIADTTPIRIWEPAKK